MLATTSIGAIWSSCSPDFGIDGVVDRLGQIQPRILFCAAAYSYNGKTHDCLDKVRGIVESISSIERTVVVPHAGPDAKIGNVPGAVWFREFVDNSASEVTFEQLPFDHPVYILYSSGTTGVPKCITHGAGGTLIQHLKELVLHTNLRRSDRLCYFTTCGWMMWNWMVSSLAVGATVSAVRRLTVLPRPRSHVRPGRRAWHYGFRNRGESHRKLGKGRRKTPRDTPAQFTV